MPPEPPTRDQLRVAELLLALRRGSRTTQGAVGSALGVSQSTVSRIERGTYRDLTVDDVAGWLDRCAADPGQRSELLDAFAKAATTSSTWAAEFTGQPGHLQEVEDRLTRASGVVLDLSTSVVPGLLQTPAYHRALFDTAGIDTTGGRQDQAAAVTARQQRQDVLLEQGRSFEFLVTRRALASARHLLGDAAGIEQLSRIAAADRHPHLRIGVLPDSETGAETGFVIYDRGTDGTTVRVELPHGTVSIYDAEAVAVYRDLFERLRRSADPLS